MVDPMAQHVQSEQVSKPRERRHGMKMSDLAKENEMLRRALEDIAAPAMFFLSRRDAIKMRDTARATLRARQALYEGDGG